MKIYFPFKTKFNILTPSYTRVLGVQKRELTKKGVLFASVRSFGGTEKIIDGVYSILKTQVLQTWYRPDIVSGVVLEDLNGVKWEIIGNPEDINLDHRYLQIKVKKIEGDY